MRFTSRRRLSALGTIVLALGCCNVAASTFTVSCNSWVELRQRGCSINQKGPIVAGDASKLRQVIQQSPPTDFVYQTLNLESPGGDVGEAVRIASVVREAMLQTRTWKIISYDELMAHKDVSEYMWQCVSACFLIWVAGTDRASSNWNDKKGKNFGLGLHRPYFEPQAYRDAPAKIAERQQQMTTTVTEYLRRERVPDIYIDKMLSRSSKEVYWMWESDNPFALDGRAPWFEETMIARCNYDPAFDADEQDYLTRRIQAMKVGEDIQKDPRYLKYQEWKEQMNGCEYVARRDAQLEMRKVK